MAFDPDKPFDVVNDGGFDPSKPYEVVTNTGFDPSKPYVLWTDTPSPQSNVYGVAPVGDTTDPFYPTQPDSPAQQTRIAAADKMTAQRDAAREHATNLETRWNAFQRISQQMEEGPFKESILARADTLPLKVLDKFGQPNSNGNDGNQPIIPIPSVTAQDLGGGAAAKIIAGINQGSVDLANSLQSPNNAVAIAASAIFPPIAPVIAGGYAGQMGYNLPEQARQTATAFGEGNTEQGVRGVVGTGIGTALTVAGAKYALKGAAEIAGLKLQNAPLTEAALKGMMTEALTSKALKDNARIREDIVQRNPPDELATEIASQDAITASKDVLPSQDTTQVVKEAVATPTEVKTTPVEPAVTPESVPHGTNPEFEAAKAKSIADAGISEGPGAASPKDFPTSTPLSQLSEIVRNQPESPSRSIVQRIKDFVDIADEWAKGKDAITQKMAAAKAASDAVVKAYMELEPFTTFKKAVLKWTAADQETTSITRQFLKDINKTIKDPLRQEAITNWIQARGDNVVLEGRAAASKPKYRKAYETAMNLTDAEKTLAQNISGYFESKLNEGIDAGILKSMVEDYVNQVWEKPTAENTKMFADLFGFGNLNPNFKFAKERIFKNYFEGEQAGFVPKDKSIGKLLAVYDSAFNRALSARGLIKDLYTGKAADGKPIAMTSGLGTPVPAGEVPSEAFLVKPNYAPEGAVSADGRPYQSIDHFALKNWKWIGKDSGGKPIFIQGDMLVHPDHVAELKKLLGQSEFRQGKLGAVMMPVLRFNALAKQTKLSLSLFHLNQEALHGVFHQVNPLNLTKLDWNNAAQKSLVEHGLMVADPRGQELFGEGLRGGGLVAKLPLGVGKLQSAFNEWLFSDYIPELKMTMALHALERNRKVYAEDLSSGKITDDQIQHLTSRQANAAFGELNWRDMGRRQTTRDFLQLSLLAPDFLEARAKFVGQALKPYGHEQRIALAFMAAGVYMFSRAMNQILDDDAHWDKPFSVFYKGREYRLRTVIGDVGHLLSDPTGFGFNRLSAFTRTGVEAATGRDARGIKRTSMEQFADFAKWFIPIPLDVRDDMSKVDAALGSAGVSSRNYGAQQQVYEMLDSFMESSKDPRIKKRYEDYKKGIHPVSDYRPLRVALLLDKEADAKKAYDKLLETRNAGTISQVMTGRSPFSGTWQIEQQFINSLSESEKKTYAKAIEERAALAKKFLEMPK